MSLLNKQAFHSTLMAYKREKNRTNTSTHAVTTSGKKLKTYYGKYNI